MAGRRPGRLLPRPGRTLGVLAVDASGAMVHRFSGGIPGFEMLTGIRQAGGRLWFAGLTGSTVATLEL